MLRIAIVTNHPPPFRIPIYEKIGNMPGVDLQLIFCSRREPNREWELPHLRFKHAFLRERFVQRGDNFVHNNVDVFAALKRFSPDVVVTTGFNPTHLYAFAYALAKGLKHVPMTDGTDLSEQALSGVHRAVRRYVYKRSHAFIAASIGGIRLYESYGIPSEQCFISCLCADNDAYLAAAPHEEKPFDFAFSGRIVEAKGPLFALHVARETARRLGRKTKILFVGSGSQEAFLSEQALLHPDLIDAQFNGFAEQHELPALYRSARIFLFPTRSDVWGVVANEACAAGLPVIVSPHAGAAGELVLDGENGFVCELDTGLWAERAAMLLTQPAVYQRFSQRCRALVGKYTFNSAAMGLVEACRHAIWSGKPEPHTHTHAHTENREKMGRS